MSYIDSRYPEQWGSAPPAVSGEGAERLIASSKDFLAWLKHKTVNTVIEKGLGYLRERIRIEGAYLFGSQLTGEVNEDSDIDLAVFSPDVDGMDFFQPVRVQSDLALECDSRLELHLFSSRALANARPTNFPGYIGAQGKRLV